MLEFIFSLEDCEVINLIPLSSRLPPDRMIRHYDSKGLFSAKSAYVLARDMILQINNGASSSTLSQSSSEFWSSIWKAHVPAKVKVCMWRACSDILPTHSRLQTRRVSLVGNCVLCGLEGESIIHLGRDCSFTRQVLMTSLLHLLLINHNFTNFKEWILSCIHSLTKVKFELLIVLFWTTWKARNDNLWHVVENSPVDVILKGMGFKPFMLQTLVKRLSHDN